jgi:branched-subunit amino acid aminotransferase/4-amino-4-deoxychorismate lyase
VKLRLYPNGQIRTEIFNPIPRLPLTTLFPAALGTPAEHRDRGKIEWTISLDTQPTEPTESTIIKTYDRSAYDRARSAVGITSFVEQREVLLYTAQGLILDGSLSTPYFHRGGRWVTPASNTGGQQGSTRRWALGKGLAAEDDVEVKSLTEGEVVFMSNAIKGFFPTVYQTKKK